MSLIRTVCPIWTHAQWFGSLFAAKTVKEQSLAAYAQHFNSVEGNTSFYHIPDEKTIKRWAEQVPNDFRFTFKRIYQERIYQAGFTKPIYQAADLPSPIYQATHHGFTKPPITDLPRFTKKIYQATHHDLTNYQDKLSFY